ncbi:MAG: signal peptidase II [Pseudomonadota bacterium]
MATKKKPLFSPARSANNNLWPWLGIAAIVILFDQLSKIAITKLFEYREEKLVTTFFNLTLNYNEGAAFGFLNNQPGWQRYFFTAIGVIATVFILYMLLRNSGQRLFCWALSLIMGGAIGNVIDRVMYGKVIDFLDFHWAGHHFATFNLADSAIFLGAMLFIFDELRRVNKT